MRPEHPSCALAAGVFASGALPRHATGELSLRPGRLASLTDRLAGRPDELAGCPDGLEVRPGRLSGRPGRLSGRSTEPDGRPTGLEDREVGARSPGAALRGGRFFAPAGRWGVATGGASRSDAEPVDKRRGEIVCPGGAAEWVGADLGQQHARGQFLRPCRGGVDSHDAFHGLRDGQSTVAPPVATALDLSEVEDSGRACAMLLDASAGDAPDERFASLASADQHARHMVQRPEVPVAN